VPGLVLSTSGGYTHAAFAVGSLQAGFVTGTRVQDIPEHTLSSSISYRHSVTDQLTLATRIENDFVGARTDATYSINRLPSYDLTNLRAGIEADGWSAMLFARNLFNQRAVLSNVLQINVDVPTYNRQAVTQPLTVGLDLRYRF
jgi:hypothetical protein